MHEGIAACGAQAAGDAIIGVVIVAVVALLRLIRHRIEEFWIGESIAAPWQRTIRITGDIRAQADITVFIYVDVVVTAFLRRAAVEAATITGFLIIIVAALAAVHEAVATGLQELAIAAAAIARLFVAIITGFINVGDLVPAGLQGEAIGAAAIA